jgi:hypothetical protein
VLHTDGVGESAEALRRVREAAPAPGAASLRDVLLQGEGDDDRTVLVARVVAA